MSDERRTTAGDAARRILGRLDKGGHMERARAVSAWREVAGAEVAGHAMGAAMRGDELIVYVDSPVWASELSALSEHYREAMNGLLGQEMVRTLRFTVSRKVSEERAWEAARAAEFEAARPERAEPVSLDPGEREDIERMAEAIHDERLREAAIRAATADLEWRKGVEARKSPHSASGGARGTKSDSEH